MPTTSEIIVSALQLPCNQDIQINQQQAIDQILKAAQLNADIVILPELHNGPYFCQREDHSYFAQAESIPGPTTETFARLAAQLNIIIVISVFEKRAPGLYHNTAVVLDKDGHIAGKYRKMHIPDDPGFYEKFYFTPGDTGFKPIATSIGKLGILVCWDQWFPEAARLMALAGAELLIHPTAIGWEANDPKDEKERQLQSWITIQRAHAIANGLPVVSCNRIGFENLAGTSTGIEFWGHSFICGPQGEFLAEANTSETKLLLATIDKTCTEKTRQIWLFLRDRRIEDYAGLSKRFLD